MKKLATFIFAFVFMVFGVGMLSQAAAPDNSGPWADFVVDYTQGLRDNGTPIDPARTDSTAALGVAEDNDTINFVALGYGGSLTLGFYNGIANGSGSDFEVVETTYGSPVCDQYPERATLEVSEDGLTWYQAASAIGDCQDLEFDIGDVVNDQEEQVELPCINYVRITDTTDFNEFQNVGHITDGYDVDGIRALHEAGNCTVGSINIEKTADKEEIAPGEEVIYTYVVSNTGVVDLDNVDVTDDVCVAPVYQSGDIGDDGIMEPGEEWTYTCTDTLDITTVNIGTASATNPNDDLVTDSDEATVAVAQLGCTLTQGFWKTHSSNGPAPTYETWNGQENNSLNGVTWYDSLWTPPKGGNVWYQLSHQWIAATLNVQNGADDSDITGVLSDAADWLEDNSPTAKIKGKDAQDAKEWASLLASFNEGEIGPGHCEELPEPQTILVGANTFGYQTPECNVTVDDDGGKNYDTVQEAIDNTDPGMTICVADGEYNEFIVNKSITIAGLSSPFSGSAKIVPSSDLVNDLILIEADNVTITGLLLDGNGVQHTGNQAAGIRIASNGGNADQIHILYNVIQNLETVGPNASNKGIQWHTEAGTSESLTNSSIKHNVIDNILSTNKGGYGIQTVGDMDDIEISHNTISNISGAWGAGIALDAKESVTNSNVVVTRNHVMDNLWSDVSVQVEHNVDQTKIVVNENNLEGMVHGSGVHALGPEVNAENNWWGDTDPSNDVFGPIDFAPFAQSAYSEA